MYRREKRIPTIIALAAIFLSVLGVVYLDKSLHTTSSSAKEDQRPIEVHFTNITDSSFSLSWLTSGTSIGRVILSNNSISATILDDLDTDNIPRPRTAHHVTIKNLEENTTYTVKIAGEDIRCSNSELCPIFTQKTGDKLPAVSLLQPVRGTIIDETGKPAETAVVYILIGKSSPLSGRVDSAGLWVIPLTNLRSQDLLSRINLSDDDLVQITAILAPGKTSTAVIDLKSIRQNLPVPSMQIGNSYNFINLISKKDQLANLTNQRILGLQAQIKTSSFLTLSPTPAKTIDILFPKEESDTTIDNRPRLRGVGIPGKEIVITVNSAPQTTKLVIGPDGTWTWRPLKELPAGTHTLSIQGYDEKGQLITVKRKFIVLKSGESVLGEATASATLTPTSSPTESPIPTSITTPTPRLTSTIVPTPTTKPTLIASVTPPATGTFQPTLFLLGGSAVLLLLGIKLFIFP